MSSHVLPPNPCLVAILLIIKTRAGVHRVFHYPENPGQDKPHIKLDYENSSEEESSISSGDDSYSSLEDEVYNHNQEGKTTGNSTEPEMDESGSASPAKHDAGVGSAWRRAGGSRDGLFGLPRDIHHFLCPPRTVHKRRFEMSIDGRVFLGWPVFAREDGTWKRKKKERPPKSDISVVKEEVENSKLPADTQDGSEHRTSMQIDADLGETTGNDSAIEDQEAVKGNTSAVDGVHATPNQTGNPHLPQDIPAQPVKDQLHMFHIVFVMNPPPLEYQLRVDEMYIHVVKKFSRALKLEQSRSDFVLRAAEKIKSLYLKHESFNQICNQCPLAKAISILYTHISTSRIAHLTLSPTLRFSLQIPIPTSISVLPSPLSPPLPGLWLTTASPSAQSNSHPPPPHFALLVLSDLPATIAEINAHPSPLAAPLTSFLRLCSPRKSLMQTSQATGIPLSDIQFLAAHLIYWRRARAIPPLHHRDTYIVSPNADMRKLKTASTQYAKLFPALPSLPKMLGMLSMAGPRTFGSLIPSKDHREAYLGILAWLCRGGWVTQLRTFGWVRVPGGIRAKVDSEVEKEIAIDKEGEIVDWGSMGTLMEDGNTKRRSSTSGSNHSEDHHHLSAPSSTSSTHTAVPIPALPSSTHNGKDVAAIIIPHPLKASGLQSRYLAAISASLVETEGKEASEAWEVCLKYFNGENALEKIAVREGWKRKRVETLRGVWKQRGVLVEGRGW
ncbi:Nitrogen permease regulator 3 [Trapelia coarctata]|nr:Nitrogen permease regulator 3 [Trapelia coarctata]